MDPNPLVSGNGVKYLEEHGIKVEGCVCNEECLAMNYVFFHYIRNKEPYVVMKTAQTLDGKIATYKGLSKWITGERGKRKCACRPSQIRGNYGWCRHCDC